MTDDRAGRDAANGTLSPQALTCLLASLNEVQQTIRAYDTKAQIMGVGFIFSVTMISRLLENLPVATTYDLGDLFFGFVLLVGPVALFGAVLYPSRRSAPETQKDGTNISGCFYFLGDDDRDIQSVLADIDKANWKAELAHEIMRLSALRALKRKRFVAAMFAAGASFAIILLANMLKLHGFL